MLRIETHNSTYLYECPTGTLLALSGTYVGHVETDVEIGQLAVGYPFTVKDSDSRTVMRTTTVKRIAHVED